MKSMRVDGGFERNLKRNGLCVCGSALSSVAQTESVSLIREN